VPPHPDSPGSHKHAPPPRGSRGRPRAGRPRSNIDRGSSSSSLAQGTSREAARIISHEVRAERVKLRAEADRHAGLALHILRLRTCLRQHLGAVGRGAPVTELQAAVALAAFLMYNHDGECIAPPHATNWMAKAQLASFLTGRHEDTLRKVWESFEKYGRIVLEDSKVRGPRRPNEDVLKALEPEIRRHVEETLLQSDVPMWVTRQSLKAVIRDLTNIECSYRTITRLCSEWGLEYGRLERPRHALTQKRLLARDVVLCQIRVAMMKGHIVCSADETFDNARTSLTHSFHPRGLPFSTFARATGAGLGGRLCLMHALTPLGLAGMPKDLAAVVGDISTPMPTCEMMFAAKEKVGDYHGNFDHATFMAWLEFRFVQWAKATFPDLMKGIPGAHEKKLCLKLDNAPYHIGTTENLVAGPSLRFDPLKCTKKVLFKGLMLATCKALEVSHTFILNDSEAVATTVIRVPINEEEAVKRGKASEYPYAEEIRVAAERWLMKNKPTVLENDAEYMLRTRLNGNAYIVWNAAGFPENMECEFVWAQGKSYTAAAWTGKRNMVGLAKDMHDGLYTCKLALPGVLETHGGNFVPSADGTCPSAMKLYQHVLYSSKGGAQMHIGVSSRLQGTMDTLQVPASLREIVESKSRNAMRYLMAQLLEAEGVPLGEGLEEDEEEDEELDDD